MAEGHELDETPGGRTDISRRLRSALRRGASAALRTAVTTSLAVVAGLVVLDAVCTWWASRGSVAGAAIAFTFTGMTGALFATYVVGVRAVGRGVIVGNEEAQLGQLVLEATLSSAPATSDLGVATAEHVRSASVRTRAAVDRLETQVDGNVVTRFAARRVLGLVTRLVGEKVAETLVDNRGDIPGTVRGLSVSVTSWLSSMVVRWMRVQTFVACAIAVVVCLLAATLLSQAPF
ncbi:hypothetical protein [Nocardioides conyzicola]|uniref:Uncharacterized protein n=1 Tax=Nocardioides conyzicola TaxID=1651781 RepID=A0ABP8XB67_9ACTN